MNLLAASVAADDVAVSYSASGFQCFAPSIGIAWSTPDGLRFPFVRGPLTGLGRSLASGDVLMATDDGTVSVTRRNDPLVTLFETDDFRITTILELPDGRFILAGNNEAQRRGEIRLRERDGRVETILTTFFFLDTGRSFDLASDQCTLLFPESPIEGTVFRAFNVCSPQPVADVMSVPFGIGDFQIAQRGEIIVARRIALFEFGIDRYDSSGQLLASYPNAIGPFAIDESGEAFWALTIGGMTRIDLATGAILGSQHVPGFCNPGLYQVEVRNGWRAAAAVPNSIPSLSASLLVLLSAALAAIAWRAL
ncbi:MAG TPA: hypothetical protein VMS98_00850 [Thermoanaerobaculia bacterium]|nr:hypothetical protein [Thermoanaerobaculia bacterium]